MSVQVPGHAAALLALTIALQDPRCANPDPLIASGFGVIAEANQSPLPDMRKAMFLTAAADFLRAADTHHPEQRMDAAADVMDQLRVELLAGALNPVPGSPVELS